MKIAVAGTGYVGLSLAVLLSQQNEVTAVDILQEKVDLLNEWKSPIQDEYIEKYLSEHEERGLKLSATVDGVSAYADADYVIIAAPTNYDPQKDFFDTSAVDTLKFSRFVPIIRIEKLPFTISTRNVRREYDQISI